MSNISYDWIMLGVAAILFAVLSFLKRKKNAGFTTRVLLATVFGIILGIAFKGHTDYVGAVGSIWSNAITALAVPLLLFSIISSITNLGESIRLKNIGAKTVFFLLLNTATASLLTLILAQAFQLGRGFHYTLPSDYKQHDVPAVLDTIVNLFPHNIAIVLQLFQETSPRSLPDWELTSACPDAQAYGRCCWRCSLSMRKG